MTKCGRIIVGKKRHYERYEKSLGEFYFEHAEKFKDRIFQIDVLTGIRQTYGDLKTVCSRVALNLRKVGVRPKDMITTCLKHSLNECVPLISGAFLGANTGALHFSQSIREWTYCLKMIPSNYLILEEECVENMEKALENLESKPTLIVLGKSQKYRTFDELLRPADGEDKFRPYIVKDTKETAVIHFSSGTTGNPKGVCVSHWDVINGFSKLTMAFREYFPANHNHVMLTFSTYYWISALLHTIMSFINGGVKLNPSSSYSARTIPELIDKYKVDTVMINPVSLRPVYLLDNTDSYDLSSLKFIIPIGSPVNEQDFNKLGNIFKNAEIIQFYGCTETLGSGTDFFNLTDKVWQNKLRSCGKCSDNTEIKVVDIETKELLGPNRLGEIRIKPPFKMNSYYNTEPSQFYDEDGFFKSGDKGYYDEDEFFYIDGRINDGFKYKTFQIPSLYLESILMEHPDVKHVAVFGIPNKFDDHHPAACVVLRKGAISTVKDIEKYFTKNVSDQYRLRGGIKIFDKLPMTPTMKIQKNKLLDLYMSNE